METTNEANTVDGKEALRTKTSDLTEQLASANQKLESAAQQSNSGASLAEV